LSYNLTILSNHFMHPYTPHLLADLEKAKENKPDKPNLRVLYPDHPAMDYEGLEYIAEWELGPMKPLKDWLGIEKEIFPPAEQLEDEDLEKVIDSFLELLQHFNHDVILPDQMPFSQIYTLLVDYLDEETQNISEGSMVMDFCSGTPEGCQLGEFCSCKDLNFDDFKINNSNDSPEDYKELPF